MTERLEFELTLDGVQAAQAQLDKFKKTIGETETVVTKIDKEIKNTERDMKALNAAIAAGGPNVNAYRQALVSLEGAKRNVGHAALELSRGIEDVQYGFGGIVNNIPGIVMALGGGAGLTAAISLTAVAMNQLITKFPSMFGEAKKTKEEIEKLDKAFQNFRDNIGTKFSTDQLESQLQGIRNRIIEFDPLSGKKLIGSEIEKAKATIIVDEQEKEKKRIEGEIVNHKKRLEEINETLNKEQNRQIKIDYKLRKDLKVEQANILEIVSKHGKQAIQIAEEGIQKANELKKDIISDADKLQELEDRNKKDKKEKKPKSKDDDDSLFNKLQNDRLKESARIQAEADRRAYSQYETEVKRLDILNAFVEKKFGEKSLGEDIQDIMNRSAEMSERDFKLFMERAEAKRKAAETESNLQEKRFIQLQKFEMQEPVSSTAVDYVGDLLGFEKVTSAKIAYHDIMTDQIIANLGKVSEADHGLLMEQLENRKKHYENVGKITEQFTGAAVGMFQDYVDMKVKGEEEAELAITATIMKGVGNSLIASGLELGGKAVVAGFSGNPMAIAMGAASATLIGTGVTLGGAATQIGIGIESRADAKRENEREQEKERKKAEREQGIKSKKDSAAGGGGITLNLSYGVAGPLPEDTARLIAKELRQGQRRGV